MAATTVGTYFNIDPLQIQAAIEAYTPSNLRSQLLKTERNTIILDAYNANPSSMQVAISNFGEMKADNKLLIIGEMRELGAIFHGYSSWGRVLNPSQITIPLRVTSPTRTR